MLRVCSIRSKSFLFCMRGRLTRKRSEVRVLPGLPFLSTTSFNFCPNFLLVISYLSFGVFSLRNSPSEIAITRLSESACNRESFRLW